MNEPNSLHVQAALGQMIVERQDTEINLRIQLIAAREEIAALKAELEKLKTPDV